MQLGRLICVEGIEGTGKTTQVDFITRFIKKSLAQAVITTREPGGTPLAESIRQLLLDVKPNQEIVEAETELLLLFAARTQHINQVIKPALNAGCWVVCDRFTEASYAYQGGGRGVSYDFIRAIESFTHRDLCIDRVILLDMPVSAAFDRLRLQYEQNNQPLDRIERESLEFFTRVRNSYLKRAKEFPNLYRIVDANCSKEQVQLQIVEVLNEWVPSSGIL